MLLSVAFVLYFSAHMVVFPNSDLNNFKAWNIEVSDEESDRIPQTVENVLICVL